MLYRVFLIFSLIFLPPWSPAGGSYTNTQRHGEQYNMGDVLNDTLIAFQPSLKSA